MRILFYNEKFSDEYLGQVRTYSNDAGVDIFVHVVASNTTSHLLLTAASHLDLSI